MKRIATAMVAICCLLCLPYNLCGKGYVGNPALSVTRRADADLEIGGELAGLPAGSTRFIAYKDLLALPQTAYVVSDDSNLPARTQISGIPLEQLERLLGAPGEKLVVAICYDGY